ncbi:MAG: hypothetical protein ACJ0E4_00560 [Gammaproteobacteria bacterium]|tara:strand:+ start:573 stop:1007 length:435 start_codon:yes stop_codon:yes gene_type:complete
MEELALQSAMFEVGLWETYQTGRGANASVGIAMVIAVWVAARFSSVAMEKGVNLVGKIILTTFAASVALGGIGLVETIDAVWVGHANALAGLDVANGAVDLSAGSQLYVDMNSDSNVLRKTMGYVFYVAGFLIATVQLWFDTTK